MNHVAACVCLSVLVPTGLHCRCRHVCCGWENEAVWSNSSQKGGRKSIWAQKDFSVTVYWNLNIHPNYLPIRYFGCRLSVKLPCYLQMPKISVTFSLEAESNLAIFAPNRRTEICDETNKYVNQITLTLWKRYACVLNKCITLTWHTNQFEKVSQMWNEMSVYWNEIQVCKEVKEKSIFKCNVKRSSPSTFFLILDKSRYLLVFNKTITAKKTILVL